MLNQEGMTLCCNSHRSTRLLHTSSSFQSSPSGHGIRALSLSLYLSIYLYIYLSIYLSICLSTYLTKLRHLDTPEPTNYPPFSLSISLTFSICLYIKIFLSLHQSIYPLNTNAQITIKGSATIGVWKCDFPPL